jgi:hypothetical protein
MSANYIMLDLVYGIICLLTTHIQKIENSEWINMQQQVVCNKD